MTGWVLYMLVVAGWLALLLNDGKHDPEMRRVAQQCPFCYVAGMSIAALLWPALLGALIWEWVEHRRP